LIGIAARRGRRLPGPAGGLALALAACLALASTLPLGGCAHGAQRRIVVAAEDIPASLDPVRAASPAEENACELVFDGMVNVAANESGAPSPAFGLAESIVQDQSDRALYRITLRKALWHDGRELDSDDVASSFAAYADPANRSPRREYLLGLISSVEPNGKLGVLVRFREPIAEFRAWYVLAFKIVPREYRGAPLPSNHGGAAGKAFAGAPVGTGPFRFQTRRGDEIVFSAEPSSWRGAPASSGIVLRRVASTKDRIKSFLKGKADIIFDTGPLDRSELERTGDVMVQSYMPHAFYSVAINLRRPALARNDARKALVRAVNRRTLLPGITDRSAGIALNGGPLPDDLLMKLLPEYFHQGFPDHLPWNPAAAAALAKASGLPASRPMSGPASEAADASGGGASSKGLAVIVPASWGEFGRRLASAVAEQLVGSGIAAASEVLPDEDYRVRMARRDYDLALVLHEGYDNMFSSISSLYRSSSLENETGISDSALDKLLASRESAVEVTAWLRDTLALHDLVSELAPYIPLFTIEKDIFYRNLRGIVIASDNPFLTAEHWTIAKP
jgi:ABC-type transport system substrate-binding protein